MNLSRFLINANSTLREALVKIESNHHCMILVADDQDKVIGLATDGDIRRKLLEGKSLDTFISTCANKDFLWESPQTSRELLMKKLDHRIHVIPLLDQDKHLVGIVSRDHLPIQGEEAVYARSRAPVRISFGGGGSDLTHYFANEGGAVINTTISIYSHATIRIRDDEKIVIKSLDLKETFTANHLDEALLHSGRFGLIIAILKTVKPDFGFELFLHSDFPMNSGLGGSAVVSASVLGCFNEFRRDKWDLHELAELAYQAERMYLRVSGGWQDQYATVFGGFNFMEFKMDQNIVHPLRIHNDILLELEENLVLCNTGTDHDSGDIHQDQREQMKQMDIRKVVQSNVELCYRMRNELLRGRLLKFGQSLDEGWQSKKKFSSKITNDKLNRIYDEAKKHGAIGGKLLGAGGGGFFLFYVPAFHKHELIEHLNSQSLKLHTFRFEQDGVKSWTVREGKNNIGSDQP